MARWSIDIKKWVDRTKGDVNAAVRAMSLEVFAKIIVRSPVDTGRFRGNWMIGVEVVPQGSVYGGGAGGGPYSSPAESPNAAAATANALAQEKELSKYQIGDKISFRNNLPYSVRLEYGHSGQAPQGMVRVTLVEFGAISRRAIRKAKERK